MAAIAELDRRGTIDLNLFTALQEELPPAPQLELAAVALLYGFTLPPRTHRAVDPPPAAFTPPWFARRFEIAKRNLDRRYRPTMHVAVATQRALDGLTCSPALVARFASAVTAVEESWHEVQRTPGPPDALYTAQEVIQAILASARGIELNGLAAVDLSSLRTGLERASKLLADFYDQVVQQRRSARLDGDRAKEVAAEDLARNLEDCIASLDVLGELDYEALRFAESRVMVMTGGAGIGKSHLLAAQVDRNLAGGAPAILLLGEHFQRGEPWSQILGNLDLATLRADDLLLGLETAARTGRQRALIVIDALNESDSDTHAMWRTHLRGMIALLASHPKIALLVSVRSGFEPAVLPDGMAVEHGVVHRGFAGHESSALTAFLRHYHLPPPQTPVLTPEYSNPLFLVLYCEALHGRRQAGDYRDLSGFLDVFAAWVEQAADRAAGRLGWDRHDDLFARGIQVLAGELARTFAQSIPRSTAKLLLEQLHPERDYRRSLFKALLDEHVLVESERTGAQYVRFQYERLGDLFTVRAWLAEHIGRGRAITTFGRTITMRQLWAESWSNMGRLEALAVVLLQDHRVALHKLAPTNRRDVALTISLRVLAWHPASAVDEATVALVRTALAESKYRGQAIEALFLLAARPRHPLNGHFLHAWLSPMAMPDRDEAWSLPFAFNERDDDAVSRLLAWVEHERPAAGVDDEILLPLALALGWTFTTSNRSIRDRATKALVALFAARLDALVAWMQHLQAASDPYVIERMLAVAYGAALRSPNRAGLAAVASAVFRQWFDPGSPPVHILARDYARGVVEFADHHSMLEPSLEIGRARPPYTSPWPEDLPSTEQLTAHLGGKSSALIRSMVNGGDFDRYIVGSNSWRFAWRYQRLDQLETGPAAYTNDGFLASLSDEDRVLWEAYAEASANEQWIERVFRDPTLRRRIERKLRPARSSSIATPVRMRDEFKRKFATAMHNAAHLFEDMERAAEDPGAFPLEVVRQHLLHEVLALGWDEPRFSANDREIRRASDYGRSRGDSERLGKKYQWMALHRVLAQIADHFRFTGIHHREEEGTYHGPWQLGRRDIDPTCILRQTKAQRFRHRSCWWSPEPENVWGDHRGRGGAWLPPADRLPDPTRLLRITDDEGVAWLVLHTMRDWDESRRRRDDELESPSRQFRYFIRAYVIHKDAAGAFLAWARTQRFYNMGALEDAGDLTPELMLRERGWSPAWKDFNNPFFSRPGWTAPEGLDHCVLPAWDLYMVEGSSDDATVQEAYTLHMPAVELVEVLALRHDDRDGYFVDDQGRLAAFDPSITQVGPRAALLRADQLNPLRERGYELVWAVHGDEMVRNLDGRSSGTSRSLSGAFMQDASVMRGYLQSFEENHAEPTTLEFPSSGRPGP